MTTENDEWLSALADDELHGQAMQQGIDALLKDPALKRRWANYHAIRDGLHGESAPQLGQELEQRVRAALADEPTILAPRRPSRAVLRHAAGLAVAASVTGVAILGIQHFNHSGLPGMDSSVPSLASSAPVAAESIARVDSRATSARAQPPVQEAEGEWIRNDQLAPYLVNHNEYSSSTNMHGMLPYVRIVGHGSNP